ncbi:hypothetical protein, partial [Salmonella sp. gx-f7]|uniref:hypothetical protein n=1 Tax=Salmonella sp. gx-f7 TaxID=2582606 RepID=UPI001F24AFEF
SSSPQASQAQEPDTLLQLESSAYLVLHFIISLIGLNVQNCSYIGWWYQFCFRIQYTRPNYIYCAGHLSCKVLVTSSIISLHPEQL